MSIKSHSQVLECRLQPFDAQISGNPPAEIMWAPGGNHQINVSKGGRPTQVTVFIGPKTAAVAQSSLEEKQAGSSKTKPYFDFNHEQGPAAAWPKRFLWRNAPHPGVYAEVEWSRVGAEAVTGKAYRAFSPSFFVDDEKRIPAEVTDLPLVMGGLVNSPAFHTIEPLWAKNSGLLTTPTHKMNTHLVSTPDADSLRAENDELRNQLKARSRADGEAAVNAAVIRGALPPKDKALHAKWVAAIEADPSAAELLCALPKNPALTPVTRPTLLTHKGGVEIIREDMAHAISGYIQAKAAPEKADFFRREINSRLDEGEPIFFGQLKDRLPLDAENSLGSVAGDLIVQRSLALVNVRRSPLVGFHTDLSPEAAFYGQDVVTRTVEIPEVTNFPGGTPTDVDATDYPVKMDQSKQARIQITALEANSTGRDIIKEHAEPLAAAIGNFLVDFVFALVTDDFTAETVLATDQVHFGTIAKIAHAMNVAGVPENGRHAWISAAVAEALEADSVMLDKFDTSSDSAFGVWKNVKGFQRIFESPALQANSINLTGFFSHTSALLLVSRVLANPQVLLGASYPGRLMTITDSISGLSVLSNQWIDQESLALNDRIIVLFGAKRGNLTCGHKLVSA